MIMRTFDDEFGDDCFSRSSPTMHYCQSASAAVATTSTTTQNAEHAAQTDVVERLREALDSKQLLAKTPLFDDRFSLQRWLNGFSNNIDQIVPKFERASNVFRCLELNEMFFDDVDALNEFCSQLSHGARYFPGGVSGYDKDGNVVLVQWLGNTRPKALVKCGRVSEFYRISIIETFLVYKLLKMQEKKRGQKLHVHVIVDMEGFSAEHLAAFNIKIYINMLKLLQTFFPDMVRQVFVINAPYLVSKAYNAMKQVLAEGTRHKVVFLDDSLRQHLALEIGSENLFPRWGGVKRATNGNDDHYGSIRIGGEPPESVREAVLEESRRYIREMGLLFTRLNVRGKQKIEVEVSVLTPGDFIYWHFFIVNGGDIEFGVTNQNGLEVWPMFRINTDYVPEYGSVRCLQSGTYRLVFDNSSSIFFGREIEYYVHVRH